MWFLSVQISPIQEKQKQNKRKKPHKDQYTIYFNHIVGSPANFIIMGFRKHIF